MEQNLEKYHGNTKVSQQPFNFPHWEDLMRNLFIKCNLMNNYTKQGVFREKKKKYTIQYRDPNKINHSVQINSSQHNLLERKGSEIKKISDFLVLSEWWQKSRVHETSSNCATQNLGGKISKFQKGNFHLNWTVGEIKVETEVHCFVLNINLQGPVKHT